HHGFTVARAAQDDAAVVFAARNGFRCGPDEVGVVAGLGRIGAEVTDGMAVSQEDGLDRLFVIEPGVVGADGDLEGLHAAWTWRWGAVLSALPTDRRPRSSRRPGRRSDRPWW